jgi:hypothetical protein
MAPLFWQLAGYHDGELRASNARQRPLWQTSRGRLAGQIRLKAGGQRPFAFVVAPVAGDSGGVAATGALMASGVLIMRHVLPARSELQHAMKKVPA